MLQQTQVKTVLPRYLAWLETFPDIKTLAAAHLDEVLKQWEGLGYYRRARFIHEAAVAIAEHHQGEFPQQFEKILKLKGIGRSTAGAISSFCFKTATPVLDGNVKRVLSAWDNREYTDRQLWDVAQQWIDQAAEPDLWNQAMMELGATHCQARKRECTGCPMAENCASAFTEPTKKSASVKVKDVHWQVHMHQSPEQGIWLQQRPDQGIWSGLWTPPITELEQAPEQKPDHIHLLTHRRIHLYLQKQSCPPEGKGRWVQSIEGYAIPTGIHRLFKNSIYGN